MSYAQSERQAQLCCLCFPLRIGVFLSAAFTVLASSTLLLFKTQFEHSMRIFGGGYVQVSAVIIGFIEVTGTIWGVIGMLGVWHNRGSYVRIYNYYQMTRLIAWVMMYFTDLPALLSCELWVTDIKQALKQQGWNPAMYKIAFSGQCFEERALFVICSISAFIFFAYLTWLNQQYQDMLEEEPNYILRIPKTMPNGAFIAHHPKGDTDASRLLLTADLNSKYVGDPVKYDPQMGRDTS